MGLLSALGKRGMRMIERPWAQPLNPSSPVGTGMVGRELQALQLFAAGQSEKRIADLFDVDPKLVKIWLSKANAKLGAPNTYRGWEDGMLPPGFF